MKASTSQPEGPDRRRVPPRSTSVSIRCNYGEASRRRAASMSRKQSAPTRQQSPPSPSHKVTTNVNGYFEARYGLRRAMMVTCGLPSECCSNEKRKRFNVATRDKAKTPCIETEGDASAGTEASKDCAGYRCEERVGANAEEYFAPVVVSAGRKRRIPQGKTTNQPVRASQVAGKAGKASATQAKRRKLTQEGGQQLKQGEMNGRQENGRRRVVDRGSPAPAKQRTRSASKTVAAKKAALSRTCSASNNMASKNDVSTSDGIVEPAVQFHSLGPSCNKAPSCGPVGLVAFVQPSAAAKDEGGLLLNRDATDPQEITTTSATVPGSSEVPCTVTEDPPSQGTFERVSVKVEPNLVAMETAVFKDPVEESDGVRSNCAHANIRVLSSTYLEGVHTDDIGAGRHNVFIDLTENDCPSTTGLLISSPGSEGDGIDLDGATCSLPTPNDCTSHLGARELSAAVNKEASATSASIGLRDFAQPKAPENSANAASIAEFHSSEEGTTTSRDIREAETAGAIARPHEPVLALVSSPQKAPQSSLMSSDDGSSISAADKCASSQGCSEDGDSILGAERASPDQRETGGDVQGAAGIVPAQYGRPAVLGLLVAPEEYSSRMCPADENIAPQRCEDSDVPVPDSVASRRSGSCDDCRLVYSVERANCNERLRQCWDAPRKNIAPQPNKGAGDEIITPSSILLSFQGISIDNNTSGTRPESSLSCHQRDSVNGDSGNALSENLSAQKRRSEHGDVLGDSQNIPREQGHSLDWTSEPSLCAADSVRVETRQLADGDRLGAHPEHQRVTYLQTRSGVTDVVGEPENITSFGRSFATADKNAPFQQRQCGDDDFLVPSTSMAPPKTTEPEQGVRVECQNSLHEPRESPVPIPYTFPLQQRLAQTLGETIIVPAESEGSAAARRQSADKTVAEFENMLTQRTWHPLTLVAALQQFPSLQRPSALEETCVAQSVSSELAQPVANPSGASEKLHQRRKNGADGVVVEAQHSLREQMQSASNDAQHSQLRQPANEEPPLQSDEIPASESRSTDYIRPIEATEAERFRSFLMQYDANDALVSERVSSPLRGPDTSESVSQQMRYVREEPMPVAQTESLPTDQTHADDDPLVMSVNSPARFGRQAGLSERTNIARKVKAHRRNDSQTLPVRSVDYPSFVDSEVPAFLPRRPADDALGSQSISSQPRAPAGNEAGEASSGVASFENPPADDEVIVVSQVFPLWWRSSAADDDVVIIESSDSGSGRRERASDTSETASSSERRWSYYNAPAGEGTNFGLDRMRDRMLDFHTATAYYVLRRCREEEAAWRLIRLYCDGRHSRSTEAYIAELRGIMRSALVRNRLQYNRITAALSTIGNLECDFPGPRRRGERPL